MTKSQGKFASLVEWLGVFLIALAFFALVRAFVITPYTVPTGSMEPTIQVGDTLFAQRVTLNLGQPVRQGDIVVFQNPDDNSSHETLVKRVIAQGGQTITLRDGHVYVDGELLDEPYTQGSTYPLADQQFDGDLTQTYIVPQGHVWVMGDNRENSADSRYFGAIPETSINGVAWFRYWPLSRIGFL